jgi:cytochrome c553
MTAKEHLRLRAQWQQSQLERCHLIAKSCRGTNDVSNFVLLCSACHERAPMIGISPQPMIEWIGRQEHYINRTFRQFNEELAAIRPTLVAEAEALRLSDREWRMLLATTARAMLLGYHGFRNPSRFMLASWASVVRTIVESLSRCPEYASS